MPVRHAETTPAISFTVLRYAPVSPKMVVSLVSRVPRLTGETNLCRVPAFVGLR